MAVQGIVPGWTTPFILCVLRLYIKDVSCSECTDLAKILEAPVVSTCQPTTTHVTGSGVVFDFYDSLAVDSCSCSVSIPSTTDFRLSMSAYQGLGIDIDSGCGSEIVVNSSLSDPLIMECRVFGSIDMKAGENAVVTLNREQNGIAKYCMLMSTDPSFIMDVNCEAVGTPPTTTPTTTTPTTTTATTTTTTATTTTTTTTTTKPTTTTTTPTTSTKPTTIATTTQPSTTVQSSPSSTSTSAPTPTLPGGGANTGEQEEDSRDRHLMIILPVVVGVFLLLLLLVVVIQLVRTKKKQKKEPDMEKFRFGYTFPKNSVFLHPTGMMETTKYNSKEDLHGYSDRYIGVTNPVYITDEAEYLPELTDQQVTDFTSTHNSQSEKIVSELTLNVTEINDEAPLYAVVNKSNTNTSFDFSKMADLSSNTSSEVNSTGMLEENERNLRHEENFNY